MRLIHGMVLAGLALSACGGGSPRGDGKPPDGDLPTWDPWTLETRFVQEAFGEISQLATGRLGPDGEAAIVTAGRQIVVRREGDLTPIWSRGWTGENETVSLFMATGLTVRDLNGDGIDDVLIATDAPEVMAWDGRDGSPLWRLPLGEHEGLAHLVSFGDPADPVFLSSRGPVAHKVSTGLPAWRLNLRADVLFAHEAVRSGGEPSLVYVGIAQTPEGQADAFAVDGDGNVVFSVDSGTFLTTIGGADLDGGGDHSMLLAMPYGKFRAIGSDAETKWEVSFDIGGDSWFTFVETILPFDQDGDGRDELVVSVTNLNRPELTTLVLLSPTGHELGRMPMGDSVPNLRLVDDGDARRLLARLGIPQFGLPGAAALLHSETLEELWRTDFPWYVTDLQPLGRGGSGEILVGSVDGRLRRLSVGNGHLLGEKYVGFFQAPGVRFLRDHVASGDRLGTISVHNLEGELAWHWSFPFAGVGVLTDLQTFETGGAHRIVALGSDEQSRTHTARLQILSEEGEDLLSIQSPLAPRKVAVGRGESGEALLAVGLAELSNAECEIQLLTADTGERRWTTRLPRCLRLSILFEDVDGDGKTEILAAGSSATALPFVTLLDLDGTVRFTNLLTTIPLWIQAKGGALFMGGAGADGAGFVSRLDTEGKLLWETSLPFVTNPADPRHRLPGDSWYGTLILDSDEVWGVAATTTAGQLHVLDGRTGAPRWNVGLYGEEGPAEVIQGGPVRFVPSNDVSPGILLVGQERLDLAPSRLFAIDRGGEVSSSSELTGSCLGLDVSIRSHTPLAGVVTTTGVSALEVRSVEDPLVD